MRLATGLCPDPLGSSQRSSTPCLISGDVKGRVGKIKGQKRGKGVGKGSEKGKQGRDGGDRKCGGAG